MTATPMIIKKTAETIFLFIHLVIPNLPARQLVHRSFNEGGSFSVGEIGSPEAIKQSLRERSAHNRQLLDSRFSPFE